MRRLALLNISVGLLPGLLLFAFALMRGYFTDTLPEIEFAFWLLLLSQPIILLGFILWLIAEIRQTRHTGV